MYVYAKIFKEIKLIVIILKDRKVIFVIIKISDRTFLWTLNVLNYAALN